MFASAALAVDGPAGFWRACRITLCEYAGGPLLARDAVDLQAAAFEDFAPVRPVAAFKGQRNFAGEWWCATNRRLVGYESWLERDHLVCLDFAPGVVGVAAQPFRVDFGFRGGPGWHVPDYFVRLADGSALVIDVRPEERIAARDRAVFAATAALCRELGWAYRCEGGLPMVRMANLRWLAGYRHPRCLVRETSAAIMDFLHRDGGPRTLGETVAAAGDPVAVSPSLFHLMWTGAVTADLDASPLRPGSILRAEGR